MQKFYLRKGYRVLLILVAVIVLAQYLFTRTVAPVKAASPGIPTVDGTIWPLGVNYAWHDFGNDFTDTNWSTRYPQMQTDFQNMAAKGVKVVRWWIFAGLASGSPLWTGTGHGSTVTGLPSGWVTNMVTMTNYAHSIGIRIYYCWISFDISATYNGSIDHDDVIDNPTVQQSFLDNAVKPIVQALGTNPGVFGWDIINEPEWIINASDNGSPGNVSRSFPLAIMRAYVTTFANYIHQYVKQPVSLGSASMKWIGGQWDFWSGLPLDFYDFHWYDWATPYFNPLKTPASSLKVDGKPVIMGEIMPNMQGSSVGMTHQQVLEGILAEGYSGYLVWAWTDSANDCQPYISPDLSNFQAAHPEINFGNGGGATVTPGPSPTPSKTNTPAPTNTTGPTKTNTPVPTTGPTNTPAPGGNGLNVLIDKGGGIDNSQETTFNFEVKNTGTSAISNISTRVYFNTDGSNAASGYVMEKYYDQSGVATISGPTLACGSTYYFTVSYGTASLAAGAQWEFQSALHLSSWASTYDGSNDFYHTGYAVGALPAAYTNTNNIPGFVNGTLTWGSTPNCGGATNTPAPTNTFVPPTATSVPPTKTPTPLPGTATAVPSTKTNTPIPTSGPSATPVPPTKTNTPAPTATTGPTATKPPASNTPNASDPCSSPTVITGGGTFSVTTAGTCFKYVNTSFVNGGMLSVMKDGTSASDTLKWYGGMDQNATSCANQSSTISGNGGQLNNFTVEKDANGQMFLTITGSASNSVTISIQNWQNGAGCSVKPTVHP